MCEYRHGRWPFLMSTLVRDAVSRLHAQLVAIPGVLMTSAKLSIVSRGATRDGHGLIGLGRTRFARLREGEGGGEQCGRNQHH